MSIQELQAPIEPGLDLFYRAWNPTAKRAVIFVHRGHEHSGRLVDVIEELNLQETAVFAWDARGHGRSPGDRGYAPSFARIVKDLDVFVRHISTTHGIAYENIIVAGHSVGAVTVASWVHDYAPPIRAMVLVTPALKVKLYVPFAKPGLRLLQALRGNRKTYVQSYVKSTMLTHDAAQAQRYANDPLITKAIAVNVLLDLYETASRLVHDAGAIRVPALVLCGADDWVVDVGEQERFYENLGSKRKKMRLFHGMYHDLLHEADRASVLEEIRTFIDESFAREETREPLLHADEFGYTKEESERLTQPAPALKELSFAAQRWSLRTLGKMSRGIRVGWETGFDSGRSLDYVYENEARGDNLLGKLIDRVYLDSIGWRGIRQRKIHLEKLLREAMRRVRAEGKPVRILDVATGCGRYVLDALAADGDSHATAYLRDYTPANVEQGIEIARAMNLSERVRFEQGDAFDEANLAAITPAPTVSIVSGLYELFGDNDLVLGSLRGIASCMTIGGYLVYTGQPWHPQLEMIARVLPNRDGKPWVMRRRTQEELDELVRAAGFRKVDMEIDKHGIFTVSLAQR
ncbi:MAG TPA: bifunctional alpha/beta hydrolase/class I SAM-dependent methyltransferase [Thermoanaerobaculia bacterium]|nr:bifunctional alpha/beta hydrolase/class I SAM-dependent methyltransferase [Thermoanaerobaculia bacterium]